MRIDWPAETVGCVPARRCTGTLRLRKRRVLEFAKQTEVLTSVALAFHQTNWVTAMPRVFISFVHEDTAVAHEVQWLLESELDLQSDVFLSADKEQVYAGDDWLQKVKEALTETEIVLLMLSRRSIARSWVNFEAGGHGCRTRRSFPVVLDASTRMPCPTPIRRFRQLICPLTRTIFSLACITTSG